MHDILAHYIAESGIMNEDTPYYHTINGLDQVSNTDNSVHGLLGGRENIHNTVLASSATEGLQSRFAKE